MGTDSKFWIPNTLIPWSDISVIYKGQDIQFNRIMDSNMAYFIPVFLTREDCLKEYPGCTPIELE